MSKLRKRIVKSSFPPYAPNLSVGLAQVENVPKQIPVLEDHITRLNGAAEHVECLAQSLHNLADQLLGSSDNPNNEALTPAAPPSLSSIGRLNDAHQRLWLARASLAEAVNRLEAL